MVPSRLIWIVFVCGAFPGRRGEPFLHEIDGYERLNFERESATGNSLWKTPGQRIAPVKGDARSPNASVSETLITVDFVQKSGSSPT